MKALSLKQPWAWLVVEGYKPIEFRWWSSKLRGEIYIHASKKFDDFGYEWLLQHPELAGATNIKQMAWCPKIDTDFGSIIGKVTIKDCMKVEQARLFYPDEMWLTVCQRTLGNNAFILENPIHYLRQNYIPYKGKLGFFDVEGLCPISLILGVLLGQLPFLPQKSGGA